MIMARETIEGQPDLEIRGLKHENPPCDFDAAFRVLGQDPSLVLLLLSSPHFTLLANRVLLRWPSSSACPQCSPSKTTVRPEALCPMARILSPCTAELLPL